MLLKALKMRAIGLMVMIVIIPPKPMGGQKVESGSDGRVWLTNKSISCPLVDQIKVDKRNIVNINPSRRKKAISNLEKESSLLLSDKQVKELAFESEVDKSLPAKTLSEISNFHSKPYLLRGVSASTTNRIFLIYRCHQDLLVFSGSLGGGAPQKDPVIAFLKDKPRKVFVTYMDAK